MHLYSSVLAACCALWYCLVPVVWGLVCTCTAVCRRPAVLGMWRDRLKVVTGQLSSAVNHTHTSDAVINTLPPSTPHTLTPPPHTLRLPHCTGPHTQVSSWKQVPHHTFLKPWRATADPRLSQHLVYIGVQTDQFLGKESYSELGRAESHASVTAPLNAGQQLVKCSSHCATQHNLFCWVGLGSVNWALVY